MSRKFWLLVEYVDENQIFGSYDVVKVRTSMYDPSQLVPGAEIYLNDKNSNARRRSKILRVSDNVDYIYGHKEILERKEERVKDVLKHCMRSIREIKSENSEVMPPQRIQNLQAVQTPRIPRTVQINQIPQMPHTSSQVLQARSVNRPEPASRYVAPPHIVIASNSNGNDSDSDSEPDASPIRRVQRQNSLPRNCSAMSNPRSARSTPLRDLVSSTQHIPRTVVSSTPHSSTNGQHKCYSNQETQTDETYTHIPLQQVEDVESVIKIIYKSFKELVVTTHANNWMTMSASVRNEMVDLIETNNAIWKQRYSDDENQENIPPAPAQETEQMNGHNEEDEQVTSQQDEDEERLANLTRSEQPRMTYMQRPSRFSEKTPYQWRLMKVPAKVLNAVNWSSHVSATKQLLRAVFPRRILATYSLTGPATQTGGQPKKILDRRLVDDIVKIVSTRCNVPENEVRNTITLKCQHEAKLYRRRRKREGSLRNGVSKDDCVTSSEE